jgi:hypothetical protein
MTVTSSANAFLNRGHTELAYEAKGQADAIDAWVDAQQPRKPVPHKLTPELRAERRRLLAALAKKAKVKKSERQVTRGRGAAVGWTDDTLRNRLRDFRQGRPVPGT